MSSSKSYLDTRGAIPRPSELVTIKDPRVLRNAVHEAVHSFREEHVGDALNGSVPPESAYREMVQRYSIEWAGITDRPAISQLSAPSKYQELRHGGTLLSGYPRLGDEDLQRCAEGIRAALIWVSMFHRERATVPAAAA
jgi:hypothetical protein